ncbi:uncharacterized protein [Amphiura filiformis]|uniref:uncharacterized protein n=1 Tax=Amphiura filiformis TaxID=82378 RepID=UPI003B212657
MLHGGNLIIDACTTCECDNSTVKCNIKSCAPAFCEEPIVDPNECCNLCPYYVPVWQVDPSNIDIVREGVVNDLIIDLNLKINERGQGVEGEGLWKVSMWGSAKMDGSGDRIGYVEQVRKMMSEWFRWSLPDGLMFLLHRVYVPKVLTDSQSAQRVYRPPIFGGWAFTIPGIDYSMDSQGATCPEMVYLCVEFGKGDDPAPEYPQLPFDVEGVESATDATSNPQHVIGCERFPKCEGVTVSGLQVGYSSTNLTAGKKDPVRIDATASFTDGSIDLSGSGLWRLAMYGSTNEEGTGEQFQRVENALSSSQQGLSLTGAQDITYNNAEGEIDVVAIGCNEYKFICFDYMQGESPRPAYTFRTLQQADPTKYTVCIPKDCEAGVTVSGLQVGYSSTKLTAGKKDPVRIYATASFTDGSIDLSGSGLWRLAMYGSTNAEGTGEQFQRVENTLSSSQQGLSLTGAQDITYSNAEGEIDVVAIGYSQSSTSATSPLLLSSVPQSSSQSPGDKSQISTLVTSPLLLSSSLQSSSQSPGPTTLMPPRASASTSRLLPCSYRRVRMLHGDQLYIDECTTCSCDNSTVKCDIKSCPPTFCDEPIADPTECCDRCPYDVLVYRLDATVAELDVSTSIYTYTINLQLSFNQKGQGVEGEGLWKVSAWLSPDSSKKGILGYVDQVLTVTQASTWLVRPPYYGGFTFTLPSIKYIFNSSGIRPECMAYLCLNFGRGNNPDLLYPQLPFTLLGVRSEDDDTPNSDALTVCMHLAEIQTSTSATSPLLLSPRPHPSSQSSGDSATTQMPPLSNVTVLNRSDVALGQILTSKSIIRVFKTEPRILQTKRLDDTHWTLTLDIRLKILPGSFKVTGTNLWKMNLWGSSEAVDNEDKFGFKEQVLNETHASLPLIANETDNIIRFKFKDVMFNLHGTDACSGIEFICARIGKVDLKDPRYKLIGVKRNGKQRPSNLLGCGRLDECPSTTSERLDSFSDSSDWQPYLPCFFEQTLLLHEQTITRDEVCQICTCIKGEIKCENDPKCDCIYNEKISIENGHTIQLDDKCTSCSCDHGEVSCLDRCSSLTSSSSIASGLLMCSYRGTLMLHGGKLIIDACTTCECDNSTVKCDIKSCAPTFCEEPIVDPNECCNLCPYYVPVWQVNPSNIDIIREGVVNDLIIDLNLKINERGQGVEGEGLWKVSMWGSAKMDGSGDRIGYVEQALSESQTAQKVQRPPFFGGFEFTIPGIDYSMDSQGATCPEMEYLCAEFGKGDDPSPVYPLLSFDVEGVESATDTTSNPQHVIGCERFPRCEGVTVSGLQVGYSSTKLTAGKKDPVRIDAIASFTDGSIDLSGSGLWRLAMYGSTNAEGTGEQFQRVENALSSSQQGLSLTGAQDITYSNAEGEIDVVAIGCNEYKFICFDYMQGKSPRPAYIFRTLQQADPTKYTVCIPKDCEDDNHNSTTLTGTTTSPLLLSSGPYSSSQSPGDSM